MFSLGQNMLKGHFKVFGSTYAAFIVNKIQQQS